MLPKWYQPAQNTIVLLGAFLLTILSVGVSLKLFGYIFPALLPFILAVFISFMLEPLVAVMQRRLKMSRPLAVLTSMLLAFGTLGTLVVLLIIQLVAELIRLSARLPEITRDMRTFVEQIIPDAINFYGELPSELVYYLQDAVRNFSSMVQSVVEVAVTSMLSFLSFVPGTVIFIIVTILATYFITSDRQAIANYWRKILPNSYGHKSILILKEILNAFWSYLKAQSILVCITTVQSMIGFFIIGFDYAITLGLVVGLLDLIPVLGPATLIIPWAVWFLLNANWIMALKLLILYAFIFVVRQLLEARVVAANLGLHPLATLLAMYIGLSLIGFVGLIAGPILLIAVKATLKAAKIDQRTK